MRSGVEARGLWQPAHAHDESLRKEDRGTGYEGCHWANLRAMDLSTDAV